jgi:kynurenine 3-monooxygenase
VTFSDRPYAEALAIGDYQNEIMQEVLKWKILKLFGTQKQ